MQFNDLGTQRLSNDLACAFRKHILKLRVLCPTPYLNTDCWQIGSGKTRIHGTIYYRMSFLAFNGEVPNGLCIRHMCHNRKCCNPEHLKLGTVYDNVQDRVNSGRSYTRNNNKNERF